MFLTAFFNLARLFFQFLLGSTIRSQNAHVLIHGWFIVKYALESGFFAAVLDISIPFWVVGSSLTANQADPKGIKMKIGNYTIARYIVRINKFAYIPASTKFGGDCSVIHTAEIVNMRKNPMMFFDGRQQRKF